MQNNLHNPETSAAVGAGWLQIWIWFMFAGWVLWLGFGSIVDSDIWFHLSAGRWIMANGWPPAVDEFSHASAGRPYLCMQWLFQLLLFAAHSFAAVFGLVLVKAGLFLGVVGLLFQAAGLRCRDGSLLLLMTAVAGCVMSLFLRPLLASLCLLLLFLWVWRRDRNFWLFPLLQTIWVNTHGLFILGPFVVFCWSLGNWRRRWPWLAATVAACLANPYGLRGVAFPFLLFTRISGANVYSLNIQEFAATWRRGFFLGHASGLACLLLLVLGLAVAACRWRRTLAAERRALLPELLLFAGFAVLYLLAQRNLPLFAVTAAWLISRWTPALAGFNLPRGTLRAALFVCLFLLPAGFRLARAARGWPGEFHDGWSNRRFAALAAHNVPAGAVDFLLNRGWQGIMFNDFNWGGYIGFRMLPQNRVFIDQRLEVHSRELFTAYLRLFTNPERFRELSGEYGFNLAILGHRPGHGLAGLFKLLHDDPDWELVYLDAMAAVFCRRSAAASACLLARPCVAPPPVPPLAELRGAYLEHGLANVAFWRAPAREASHERHGWGFAALQTGRPELATAFMLDAALRSPQVGNSHFFVAMAALRAGDRELFNQACRYAAIIQPAHPELAELAAMGARTWGENPLEHGPQ